MPDDQKIPCSGSQGPDSEVHPQIDQLIIIGDSLTDRGTLKKRYLMGFFPMKYLSIIRKYMPYGRFTNGMVWSDHFIASLANCFTVNEIKALYHNDSTFISDAIISKERRISDIIDNNYALGDDKFVHFKEKTWVRSYCEGGLSSHNYKLKPSLNIGVFLARVILTQLKTQREKIFLYDKRHHVSFNQKAHTLIIEWSGGNDLLTVNEKPTIIAVNAAIEARVTNVKEMIAEGYRHFVLFNMPNLALIPRYKDQAIAQKEIEICSKYFNTRLNQACQALSQQFSHCNIDVFNVNQLFTDIFNHSVKYHLDPDKNKSTYIDSKDYNPSLASTSSAKQYMFYDDIHPTAYVHALIANELNRKLAKKYRMAAPNKSISLEKQLCQSFKDLYEITLSRQTKGFFNSTRQLTFDYKNASLQEIFRQVTCYSNPLVVEVLKKLGWINASGEILLEIYTSQNQPTCTSSQSTAP